LILLFEHLDDFTYFNHIGFANVHEFTTLRRICLRIAMIYYVKLKICRRNGSLCL
jgi:hypothetical protein